MNLLDCGSAPAPQPLRLHPMNDVSGKKYAPRIALSSLIEHAGAQNVLLRMVALLIICALVAGAGCNLHRDLDDIQLTGSHADIRGGDGEAKDVISEDAPSPVPSLRDSGALDTQSSRDSGALDTQLEDTLFTDASDIDAQEVLEPPDGWEYEICDRDMGPLEGECRPSDPYSCPEGITCRLKQQREWAEEEFVGWRVESYCDPEHEVNGPGG